MRSVLPFRKNLTITTIFAGGSGRVVQRYRAPAGKGLTASGIDKLLEVRIEETDRFFPGREFRLVPLRDGNFNLVEIADAQPSTHAVS